MIVRAVRTSPSSRWSLVRSRIDPRDVAGHEDLGAEPPRLLQRAARELVAREALREAEVVLDARRGAGLAAGRLALDDERAEPLGGPVDGGGEPGGAGTDHDDVVLGTRRLRGQAEQLGDPAKRRPDDRLPADHLDRGLIVARRQRSSPLLLGSRRAGCEPPIRDLVAVEESAKRGTLRLEAVADHDRAGRRRLCGQALEPAGPPDAMRRERPDCLPDVRRRGRDRVESRLARAAARVRPRRP